MTGNAKVTDCYDINCRERLVFWSDGIREPVLSGTTGYVVEKLQERRIDKTTLI